MINAVYRNLLFNIIGQNITSYLSKLYTVSKSQMSSMINKPFIALAVGPCLDTNAFPTLINGASFSLEQGGNTNCDTDILVL